MALVSGTVNRRHPSLGGGVHGRADLFQLLSLTASTLPSTKPVYPNMSQDFSGNLCGLTKMWTEQDVRFLGDNKKLSPSITSYSRAL